jgi:hypothetical protein
MGWPMAWHRVAGGDIILYEVASGLRTDRAVAEVRGLLACLTLAPSSSTRSADA